MNKVPASVQHVSIFRIENLYLIGVLYDFKSDNQKGSLDIIVQGNNLSFAIDPSTGPEEAGTGIFSGSIHILSEGTTVPVFNVNKGNDVIISVPVFSIGVKDRQRIGHEISGALSAIRQSVTVVPSVNSVIPADVAAELGIESGPVTLAREWGWAGW